MEQYLEIGKIVNTHGLSGEMKVVPWADYPEVFDEISFIYNEAKERIKINSVKYQKGNVLLCLDGVDSAEKAERLKGKIIYVRRDTFSDLPENTYFITDLIGISVMENDVIIGTLSEVLTYGSADVYVIKREGKKDLLLPAVKEVIKEINIPKGMMKVIVPDGLDD